MSSYTDYLNLFKWDPQTDADEEFDIEKALNENWDKIDKKLKDYITNMDKTIGDFQTSITQQIENFETSINQTVQNLADSISSTQAFHRYKLIIDETTENGAEVILPCNYKVGAEVLDVYLNGERLVKADSADTEGHYYEVGEKLSEIKAIGVRQGGFCSHPYTRRVLGIPNNQLQEYINKNGIPGLVRVSLGIYNSKKEANIFLESGGEKCSGFY